MVTNPDKYGRTFCVLPWLHAMNRTHGTMMPCCITSNEIKRENGVPYYLWESSISEIWNSPYYREIRRKMLAGEEVEGCQRCYDLEKRGLQSLRQCDNKTWFKKFPEVEERIERSRLADFAVADGPVSFDLRLGNLCNLRCRSCSPHDSSALAAEWKTMMANNPEFERLGMWSGKYYDQPRETPRDEIPDWPKSETFWSEIERFLPHVKFISLVGGETQMVRSSYRLLQKCVDLGVAKDIELLVISNMTLDSEQFRNLLPLFKKVKFNCSIDAYGEQNHYLRYPSDWRAIDKNMRALLQLPAKIDIHVVSVIQYHNVLNIDRLYDYAEELQLARPHGRVLIETLVITGPDFLTVGVLPKALRLRAVERVREFTARSRIYRAYDWSRSCLDDVIRVLLEEAPANAADLLQQNQIFTRAHDQARAMRLEDYFPELGHFTPAEELPL